MCACGRSNEKEKKVSFAKEQHDREQEKRKQYKLQAKWSPSSLSSIDRPSARRRKSKGKKDV
jgi:hypothetical protein